MKQDDIVNGNKLIAQFLDCSCDNFGVDFGNDYWYYSELMYHTHWDWLMSAVTKIEKTHQVCIICEECEISTTGYNVSDIVSTKAETKIQAVWLAVIEFIKQQQTHEKPS